MNTDQLKTEEIIARTLNELRITDSKIRQNALTIVKNMNIEYSDSNDYWIFIMKVIISSCESNYHSFSKSELCDLLTIGARGPNKELIKTSVENKVIDNSIFNIYKDIMENFDNSDDILKSKYPKIILNIISIIQKGVDLNGDKINIYGLERYYHKIKNTNIILKDFDIEAAATTNLLTKKNEVSRTNTLDFINSLSIITGRDEKDLENLLQKIPEQDYKKVADLCINYNKLQKYSKLLDTKEFRDEVEKELGRKLTDRQLQHATISIRKVKIYLENILDGKFLPHGSHGINHVKHNLEYGYQIMGLIEYRRRKQLNA